MREYDKKMFEFRNAPDVEKSTSKSLDLVDRWPPAMRYIPDQNQSACNLLLAIKSNETHRSIAILDALTEIKDSGQAHVLKEVVKRVKKNQFKMGLGIDDCIERHLNQYLNEVESQEILFSSNGKIGHAIEQILTKTMVKNPHDMCNFLESLRGYAIKQLHPILAEKIGREYAQLRDQQGQYERGVDSLINHYQREKVFNNNRENNPSQSHYHSFAPQ